MACHYSKDGLYKRIEQERRALQIEWNNYPLNLITLCREKYGIEVTFVPFVTEGLQGMFIPKKSATMPDIIMLNDSRNDFEQNFSCAHEFIHFALHKNEDLPAFNFDSIRESQNHYFEWQANEGAAELLVPYKMFIPQLTAEINRLPSLTSLNSVKHKLSKDFHVTTSVIENRINSLKYEIYQYQKGVPLDKIQILSNNQLIQRGIKILSLNDVCEREWDKNIRAFNKKCLQESL